MSLDSAFRQLREANPIPDPASLTDASEGFADLLTATRQRSTEVQTQERTPDGDKVVDTELDVLGHFSAPIPGQ